MQRDRQFKVEGDWALGSDGIQWILYRRHSQERGGWTGVSFVHSTKDILARCMREKGTDEDTAKNLLTGLPDSFEQWKRQEPPLIGALNAETSRSTHEMAQSGDGVPN